MSFKLYSTDDGRVPPIEYLPCGAITPKFGMALYQTAGNLAIASGANIATYISQTERSTACTAGDLIPVVKLQPDQVWEALKDSTNAMVVGTAYDVATGGLLLDDNGTTGANFQVRGVDSAAQYAKVRGRFIKFA
jgi:hypothetical protein